MAPHKPVFVSRSNSSPDRAMPIDNPGISWAFYTELSRPGEVDYYRFVTPQEGLDFFVQIAVPQLEGLEEFHPSLALIGPGLGEPTTGTAQVTVSVPFLIPEGEGAIVKSGKGAREPFYEPFTQTRYWRLPSLRLRLPGDRVYYLAVYSPEARTGKYVLCPGEAEEFGVGDIVSLPATWWRVHSYFEATPPVWALIPAGAVLVAALPLLIWRFALSHH